MNMHRFNFTYRITKDHSDVVHALEDMDDEQASQLLALPIDKTDLDLIMDIPAEDRSKRIWAILRNIEGVAGGTWEDIAGYLAPAERLMDVLRARLIKNYTYQVSDRLIRGARPSPQKLTDLYLHNKVRSTINLCREMHHGDDPIVDAAGLGGKLKSEHIPVTDNERPTYGQILQLFAFINDPDNVPAYIHCEQGIGRTSVMIACYRIAYNKWSTADTIAEAKAFGLGMPNQIAFVTEIEEFVTDFERAVAADSDHPWAAPFKDLDCPHEPPETPPSPPVHRDEFLDEVHANAAPDS